MVTAEFVGLVSVVDDLAFGWGDCGALVDQGLLSVELVVAVGEDLGFWGLLF